MPDRPNFLLIFPDQWRGDCLGTLGHPVVETPFLDQLAAQGVTFTSAYTACPSCIATRACLATGRTPNGCGRMGYQDGVPWRYETTLMRCLRDGGYQTLSAGKTHFYPQRVALGFEEMRLYDVQKLDPDFKSDYHAWLEQAGGGLVRDTTQEITSNAWLAHPWVHPEYLHPNTWTATAAIELLSRRDPMRPFFLQVGFHRPHPPLDPPIEYYERYQDRPIPPVPVGDWAAEFAGPVASVDASAGSLPDNVLARSRRAYYAQMSHLDYQIGRLLFWLGKRGSPGNTWVIFMSDHGELLGDHSLFRKTVPLEGSAKVPLIVQPPESVDCPRWSKCKLPVTHMDLMPTILEEAGLEIPETVEGSSLAPLVRGEETDWREFIHGEHSGAKLANQYVTDGKEKYMWHSPSDRELFFDLTEDPQEEVDRSKDPAYAQRVELWRRRLIAVLAERPEDGLSDGERLIPGRDVPAVRPELLEPRLDPDGQTGPP
jgi:arylsulfatase A-like enzyme